MNLTIDVSDWHERYQKEEPNIKTFDDVLKLRQGGYKPYSAGILALVARERGDAEPDILPANKILLGVGAAVSVSRKESEMKRKETMPSGLEVEMREWIAPIDESQPASDTQSTGAFESVQSSSDTQVAGDTLLSTSDPQALVRAILYLENVVPGYIFNRLTIVALHKGNVKGEANKLIRRIKEMVKEIEG